MLYLFTGVPGAGKTLNTIKFISEDPLFKNRQVYYFQIPQLNPAFDWIELSESEAINWDSLPEGSIIIFDEAQRIFRPAPAGSKVPAHMTPLETHRHKGFDLVFITQHPTFIHTHVRKLCNHHSHFDRAFGFNRIRQTTWQKCCATPDKPDFQDAELCVKKSLTLDKKYFDAYKSSEIHTHSARIPKKLYVVIGLLLLSIYLIYSVISSFSSRQLGAAPDMTAPTMNAISQTTLQSVRPSSKPELTFEETLVPRVNGFLHTAPRYDQLTKPRTVPRPACVRNEKTRHCFCLTQQGTSYPMSQESCNNIVDNGVFDDSIPDRRGARASGRVRPADHATRTRNRKSPIFTSNQF